MVQEVYLNTQVIVRCGPAVAIADGFTMTAALDITTADSVILLKAGGGAGVDISANTFAAVATCDGYYDLTLTAAQLDTLGDATVVIEDVSLCYPVIVPLMVMPENYDTARQNLANFYNSCETGTAQAASTTTTIRLAAGASAVDDIHNGSIAYIYAGTAAGYTRAITDYNGTTKDATVAAMTQCDATSKYIIIPNQSNTITVDGIADGVWDEDVVAAHNTADTAGKLMSDNLDAPISTTDAVCDTIAADVVTVDGLVDTLTTNLATANANIVTIDGLVDAMIVTLAALNDISAAEVNAEVVDALNVDTYAEPGQETPTSTTTLVDKIGYLYKMMRNRKTQTATVFSLYNDDAVTVDQKSTTADDGTTVSTTEITTGP